MFTGIVEGMGTVLEVEEGDGVRRMWVEAPAGFLEGVAPGDSISVDGACLTPVKLDAGRFSVEVIGTTLSRTVAGHYASGSRVNLERALALGDRLDGHLVQGHVDGVGELKSTVKEGDFWRMVFRIPPEVWRLTLLHGSITMNGVSLTVNTLGTRDEVEVGIIPHTWHHTNLSLLVPGDPVNVEGDLIGKYVGRLMARSMPPEPHGNAD